MTFFQSKRFVEIAQEKNTEIARLLSALSKHVLFIRLDVLGIRLRLDNFTEEI